MTLKEKVKQMNPECVGKCFKGGVKACPSDYDYLNSKNDVSNCDDRNCEECWNQEFVETMSLGSDINVITETEGVALVINGKWVQVDDNKERCSNCGTIYCIYSYPYKRNNYCPNCGAKMEV